MLAGHVTLKVLAAFVVSLSALGTIGIVGAILPLLMTVAITALESLMSVIQGLRLHDADMHVPQRRGTSISLRAMSGMAEPSAVAWSGYKHHRVRTGVRRRIRVRQHMLGQPSEGLHWRAPSVEISHELQSSCA